MDRVVSFTVSDLVAVLADAFPPVRAESWDRNGLLVGDPEAVVTGVVLSLDPTLGAIRRAVELGANVLVTHHPTFLEPPVAIVPGGPAGVVYAAAAAGVALVNAHTPLDRDPAATRLWPDLLGLTPLEPLERGLADAALVTVFVTPDASGPVTEAMLAAGAGRIGEYAGCSFSVEGTGSFTVPAEGTPHVGRPGAASTAREERIEVIAPAGRASSVVAAACAAHPYEEPLVTVTPVRIARNAARLGMVSGAPDGETVASLAARVAKVAGSVPRVWGDPDAPVATVASSTGSAGSLIGDALAAGADALVAGEVRYHDASSALASGLAVIELGHDVSEWPLVGILEQVVLDRTPLDRSDVHRLPSTPFWWTPDKEIPE